MQTTKHTRESITESKAIEAGAKGEVTELTRKLQVIYKAQDVLPKLIEDASIPEQKMDEYYVKLQIIMEDKTADEARLPIELQDMFNPAGKQGAVGRVLVHGVAGVGKTTFLNHIAYEWGKGRVFGDKFDYVFKVRLKSLLDESLCDELDTHDTKDKLAAFIQRCIEQQQVEQQYKEGATSTTTDAPMFTDISIAEIKAADKTRTVLLLDGYDEIEHLNRGTHVVRELLNKIFDYPNVVLTSRPNAVSSSLENRFERKIENIGLGYDGVDQYIDKYFSKQAESLNGEIDGFMSTHPTATKVMLLRHYEKQRDARSADIRAHLESVDGGRDLDESLADFKVHITKYHQELKDSLFAIYKANPILRETLTTPINTAMICLVSSDLEVMAKFKGYFNTGELYEGVVVWLGKRYLHKFQKDDLEDLNFERILNLDELKVLKTAAHDKFIINKLMIPGNDIDRLAHEVNNKLGIRQLNKFGLLKAETGKIGLAVEMMLYGTPEDGEIKPGKLYLYLEGKQLWYSILGRAGVERNLLDGEESLKSILDSIKNAITKKQRQLAEPELQALSKFGASKGYAVYSDAKDAKSPKLTETDEVKEAKDLIHRNHFFIHLSFQEYLTAYLLKEKLMGDLKPGVTESAHREAIMVADFIAEHRNEARYLMTLKFLSGLVTKEESEVLVTRFWEAMTCNVDGVLELGADRKVTLLMHLLAQARREGELDARIPNLKKIVGFIDSVVLKDLLNWEETIKLSGYLSSNMKDSLLHMLEGDLDYPTSLRDKIEEGTFSPKAKSPRTAKETTVPEVIVAKTSAAISMVAALSNKFDARKIFDLLKTKYLAEGCNWHITKAALNAMAEFAKPLAPLPKEEVISLNHQLIDKYLNNNDLRDVAVSTMGVVVGLSNDISQVSDKMLDRLIAFLRDKEKADYRVLDSVVMRFVV
ncbi:NACHT domain-containing protein [Candidatus Bandiella euplotis]|uniref:P-loop containing nucleoside triphosphate hydrolase family protein n=1 Tax=Candidatus Bandiella euplotis TaxID=1664265 RepID=A0ABZ0UJT2_9RICK|nr:NACHT domain-containing protein [Candidatus Bandiella woodruffii]WPX96366.1 Putative P-loop containing nucleoside triphosphate hydrolase family protein [Candidatus Bandiella woodruffii]